ncbi:MAG: DUF4331 domain-containing protein [Ilumatobacteraceae bacterium]
MGGAAAIALVGGVAVTETGPFGAGASSHREAPLIAGDPRADNTDVYAFVSPDDPDMVTIIANWIPFEEPNGGPNYYTWADDTRYTINIDNDGDALPDLTYAWVFDTVIRDANEQFLSNTGQVTSLDDPDLNVFQTYDLTVTAEGGGTTNLLGNGDGVNTAGDPISAPSIAGAASMPDYTPLRDGAIYDLPGGGKAYAGQADDPFFLDLRVFDLLYGGDASELGQDTLAGYNVNSIAIQVPKSELAINGDADNNPVIGVWSTTERRSAAVAGDMAPDNQFVQVSRLGNPLVNEVVVPLALKDAFNSISPDVDATVTPVVNKVLDPILPKLIEAIYGVPAPEANRNDLFEIFLTGISQANAGVDGDPAEVLNVDLNSQDLNADAAAARGGPFQPSEMLRLNMAVPPAATPNPYGVLAGDVAGFPNGRRLTDDVVDIAIQAVEGAAMQGALIPGLEALDSVDRNDRAFGDTFPYLALPHVDAVNLGSEQSPRAPEYISLNPERLLDTRSGAKPAAGSTVTLQVAGAGGSMVPSDADAVFLNVTADGTDGGGFVTVYACDEPRPTASNFNPVAGSATTVLVATKLSAAGTVCLYTSTSTHLIADIQGYAPASSSYVPTAPVRILETREGAGQIGYSGATPAGGTTITLPVLGKGTPAVPADAQAVLLSVTSTNSSSTGYITMHPCGTSVPTASNLNVVPGLDRANLVPAKIGADGTVCLYLSTSTDVIVDLVGYVPAGSSLVVSDPERVLETRQAAGFVNYSGQKPIAGQTIELKVTGFGTTQIPDTAGAVFLNLTATESTPGGYATVYPCGSPRPTASNLNFTDQSTPNLVLSSIGEGGRVCIFTSASTHLVADINGYFPETTLVGS